MSWRALRTALLLALCTNDANSQEEPVCRTPLGRPGSCIDIKLCPYLLDALLANTTRDSLQYLRNSSCDPRRPSHVCCDRRSCATSDGQAGACVARRECRVRAQGDARAGGCAAADAVCCPRRTFDGYLSRKSGLPEFGFCGIGARTDDGAGGGGGGAGGGAALPGQFPWAALLLYRSEGSDAVERCGGALVSARFVVTAAHCLDDRLVQVRLGALSLAERCTDVRGGCPVTAGVARALAAPTYDAASGRDDIALLTLAAPAPYADHIRPICLPDSTLPAALQRRPELLVAGWGVTRELSGNELDAGDSRQNFSRVPLRGAVVCREALKVWENLLAPYRQRPEDGGGGVPLDVPAGGVCAGGTFAGELCAQDSGGALVFPAAGGSALLAVHGRFVAGCRAPVPALYTPALPHVPWIRRNIAAHYGVT